MATQAENAVAPHKAPPWSPHVPDPVLQQVDFPAELAMQSFDRMGVRRQFYDVIVCKGSFDLRSDGLKLASPAELVWADEYWDDDNADLSSVKATADLELYKPSTDVLVTGTVKSFEGKPRKEWGGMLRVIGGKKEVLIQKTLRFTGPRWWTHSFFQGWTLSDPEPATAVPLRYERAYGGYWIDPKETDSDIARHVYEPNPSGSGHFGKSHDPAKVYPGPQIELPAKSIGVSNRDYLPGGFGPLARFWLPRVKWAGTHDAAWLKQFNDCVRDNQLPDYASDFDYRHFQAAPVDQITPTYLRGDEWIELAGLFENTEAMIFQLPNIGIGSELLSASGDIFQNRMKLDTLHIDLDTRKVHLTWRLTLPQSDGITYAVLKFTSLTNSTKDKK